MKPDLNLSSIPVGTVFYCDDRHEAAFAVAEISDGERNWHRKIKLYKQAEPEVGAKALCHCGKPIIFWVKNGVPNGV